MTVSRGVVTLRGTRGLRLAIGRGLVRVLGRVHRVGVVRERVGLSPDAVKVLLVVGVPAAVSLRVGVGIASVVVLALHLLRTNAGVFGGIPAPRILLWRMRVKARLGWILAARMWVCRLLL